MTVRRTVVGLVCALALGLRAGPGHGAELMPSQAERDAPLDISADSFSAVRDGWVTASGNVRVRQGDTQVTADQMRVNQATGEIVAEGGVILIRQGQAATRTERLVYNYKTGEGLTPKIDLQIGSYSNGVFRVVAEAARRRPDGSYQMQETVVTTCTNALGHLHYHVRGREADMRPDDYVALSGVTPYFMGVPFFYFPYWRRELDEHYGWRFEPGYDSDWGAFLLSTYKFQLIDFGGAFKDSLDSRTHFDYRTERGGAVGQDLAWHFGPPDAGHKGFVSAYYLADDKPMDEDWDRDPKRDLVEDSRYRFTFRHDSAFSPRDFLALRTSFLSDSYLLEDFYEEEYEDLVQPDSFAAYAHAGDGYSFGLAAYQRANEFYNSINRLPEAWFDVYRTDLGGSRLYYESQTRGGGLEREFADYGHPSNTVAEAYDTLRFDTRHAVYLPGSLLGFLSVMPRAAYRGTYYGDTFQDLMGAPGVTNGVTMPRVDDGAGLRNLFELGAEASFKAYGLYGDPDDRFRHVVEPYLNYTFVPEPDLRPWQLMQFDDVDTLDKRHDIRFGTRHQIQRRAGDAIHVLLDADIYGIYDIEDAQDESGLSTIGLRSRFRPVDGIRFQLDGTYDVDRSEINEVNTWITLWNNEIWEAAGEMFYRPDSSTLFAGSLTFSLSDHWTVNVYSRYEAETSRLEEQSGYIQYNLDCISFRLRGSFYPGFTRDDGTEREDKYRIAFYAWLRAFPSPPRERLRGTRDI
ncbi:MAG: LPS-assembly protein LptD [Lentisphaerae bacterium]|nr:LPS-assembly protein LptD [Lentisphaerota bacterium]